MRIHVFEKMKCSSGAIWSPDGPKYATNDRTEWLDIARGIGILLVVFGHALRGLVNSGVAEGHIWSYIDFTIYTFHMPLFFFLSGLNIDINNINRYWLAKRAKSIAIPYFVFSLLMAVVSSILAEHTNGSRSLQDILGILWNPISPFWFLYVLFIYVVLVSLTRGHFLLIPLALLSLLISPAFSDFSNEIPFQICFFMIFFVFGVFTRMREIGINFGLGSLLMLAIWVAGSLLVGVPIDGYYRLVLLPAAWAGTWGIMWLSQSLVFWRSFFAHLGKNALAIYVMHILGTAGARIVMLRLGVDDICFHITIGTAIGVAAPLLAQVVLQKMCLAQYAGLPPR